MTEQQTHLQSAIQQQNVLLNEIQKLQTEIDNKRQLAVKAQGIIEYLDQIGVKLPEPEAAPAEGEAPTTPPVEGEVVNAEGPIPTPEVSTNFN